MPPEIPILDAAAPCEQVVHPAMFSVPFQDLIDGGKEETEEWILTNFPTATVTFQPVAPSSDGGWFSWSEYDKDFTLSIVPTDPSVSQSVHENPTLGHIIRCFGEPKYYLLEQKVPVGGEAIGDRLQVWYPELGLIFMAVPIPIAKDGYDANTVMNYATVVRPATTVEELVHFVTYNDGELQKRYALLKKWPDSFTEIPAKR